MTNKKPAEMIKLPGVTVYKSMSDMFDAVKKAMETAHFKVTKKRVR